MDWITLSLASALLSAMVIVADKRLLGVYLSSIRTFLFLIGLLQLLFGVVILSFSPWDSALDTHYGTVVILSGFSWVLGLIAMFYGVNKLEVSRVIPIAHTYPVFVTILALVFLGEDLSSWKLLAIMITVSGAGLITRGQGTPVYNGAATPIYLVVLLGSVLTAIGNVSYKYALDAVEFWDLNAVRAICGGVVLVICGYHRRTWIDILALFSSKTGTGLFVLTEVVIAPVFIILMALAMAIGPVSLVSTLLSVRPMFVLLITGLLSTKRLGLLEEPWTRSTLPAKLLSISMIFAGVMMLTVG